MRGYMLVSENLSNLGGPMGSERTYANWREYFLTIRGAKDWAEKDYGQKIYWTKSYDNAATSGDLRYVMYTIKPITIRP